MTQNLMISAILLFAATTLHAQTEVSTLADLDNIRNDLNADYILVNDIDASPTADPGYNGGEGWLPLGRVGESAVPFAGTLDGQGFTITGLTMDRPESSGTGQLVGLFARLGLNAAISNLHLEEVNVIGDELVGGIAGGMYSSTSITSCSVSGHVRGHDYVGGVVGFQSGGTIEDCWTEGEVEGIGATGPLDRVGGLVGLASASILRSHSTCNVTGSSGVGGLVGVLGIGATIEECFAAGDVTSTASIVGGLVGEQNGSIVRSYATGTATAVTVGSGVAGGLVGRQAQVVDLVDSFARGNAGGLNSIGGLLGGQVSTGTIDRCYSTGVVPEGLNRGGLLGFQLGGNVSSSYWDTESSGLAASAGGAGAIGRTTAEMTAPFAANTYEGWDFDEVWLEEAEVNDGYPAHQWQTVRHTLTYTAGVGGSIEGDAVQVRIPGVSGSPVTAVPNDFQYAFVEWSDGSTENPRTDLKVMQSVSVSAIFVETNLIGVSTLADLDNIRNDMNENYILLNDIDASATADPGYNGGEGWLPIGRQGSGVVLFSGSLDGQGHTISGLTFNRPLGGAESGFNAGLFGGLRNQAVVSNLHLVDVYLTGYNQVGGIAGVMRDSSTVANCSVSGRVVAQLDLGGLVGNQISGVIENSWTEGEVIGVGSADRAGGLAGFSTATIRNSYSTCDVTGADWVGGLVGRAGTGSIIEECFAAGDVTGSSSLIGGLVGAQSGIIARCYVTGDVIGEEGNFGSFGSLVGRQDTGADLQDSFARGDASGSIRVGGLLGQQRGGGEVNRCFSTGIPTGDPESVGGLLGSQEDGSATTSYWDTETSGILTSDGGAGVTGLTTMEMTIPFEGGAYNGWDFDDVWVEEAIANDGYPIHWWQNVRHTLQYAAGAGGSLEGDLNQVRIPGLDGAPVTAVPSVGFEFLRWSDGVTDNPRQDTNVTSDVDVTAIFVDPDAVPSGLMIY